MTKRWKFEFELEPSTIANVRRQIGQIIENEGGAPEVEAEIEVAVGEILLNASHHAYHGRSGPLQIEVSLDHGRLEILIHDHGAPLTTPPTIPRSRPIRVSEGMGLYMVGRLMDEAEIIHPAKDARGTAVRLVKNLHLSPSPEDDDADEPLDGT
ncbi:MAG TPA: ATP-binding protein [bacterium]|nr:ATP-binding protein [bacterium]